MISIDEAIARERKLAEIYRNDIVPKEDYHNMPWKDLLNKGNEKAAEEHEQLAEWLELLKWYEQGMEDIPSESGVLPKDVYNAGYNKAIDDALSVVEWDGYTIDIKERIEQLKKI